MPFVRCQGAPVTDSAKNDFPSESGHYYYADGRPCYEVPMKTRKGEFRPTRITDAIKMGLAPGVTTITAVAHKPGLEIWKQEQVLMAALTTSRRDGESDDDFRRRIKTDAKEQAAKAAARGTLVHGAIERALRGESVPDDCKPQVAAVLRRLEHFNHPETATWATERSFCYRGLYGGKVDLHAKPTMKVPGIVVDFKGKEGDLSNVKVYDENIMQVAAYREGLRLPGARGAVIFFSRDLPEAKLIEFSDAELTKGYKQFRALLDFWRLTNLPDHLLKAASINNSEALDARR